MAQKTFIQLVDDLDGKPLDEGQGETVVFNLDGAAYEIDLSKNNAGKLRDALAPYIKAGRRVGGRARRGGGRTRRDAEQLGAVRAWAKENGYKVSDRGRIPKNVMEAFEAAH